MVFYEHDEDEKTFIGSDSTEYIFPSGSLSSLTVNIVVSEKPESAQPPAYSEYAEDFPKNDLSSTSSPSSNIPLFSPSDISPPLPRSSSAPSSFSSCSSPSSNSGLQPFWTFLAFFVMFGLLLTAGLCASRFTNNHTKGDCQNFSLDSTACHHFGICANELLCQVVKLHEYSLDTAISTHQTVLQLLVAKQTSGTMDQGLWKTLAGQVAQPLIQEIMMSLMASKREFDSLRRDAQGCFDDNNEALKQLSRELHRIVGEIQGSLKQTDGIWSEESRQGLLRSTSTYLVEAKARILEDQSRFASLASRWNSHGKILGGIYDRISQIPPNFGQEHDEKQQDQQKQEPLRSTELREGVEFAEMVFRVIQVQAEKLETLTLQITEVLSQMTSDSEDSEGKP